MLSVSHLVEKRTAMCRPTTPILLCLAIVFGLECKPDSRVENDANSGPTVGNRYLYSVRMSSKAKTQASVSSMFDFELTGQLAVVPMQVSKESSTVLFSFEQATFATTQGDAAKARFELIAKQLQNPHAFTFASGKVTEAKISNNTEAVAVGILRSLANHFQFPQKPINVTPLQVEEYDATGRYLAEYSASKSGSKSQTITRRKLRYLELITNKRAQSAIVPATFPLPEIVESNGTFVRKSGMPVSLRSSERIDVELIVGRKLLTRNNIEIALLKSEPTSPVDVAALERNTVRLLVDQPYVHASSVFDLDKAKIGDRTFDGVVSALEALSAEKKREGIELVGTRDGKPVAKAEAARAKEWAAGSLQNQRALAAMLRKSESNVDRAVAIIRGGSSASKALLSSLSEAGTEYAQQALLDLMRESQLPESTRKSAGLSLIRTKRPSIKSAEALLTWLRDPKWQEFAILGLGTFVRLFGESSRDSERKRFGDEIIQLLKSSHGKTRVEVLLGLSNSGYEKALPAIRPFLSDPDPELRSAAVKAVRLMKHPDVDSLIIDRLRNDNEREVRLAALYSIRNRRYTSELGTALGEILKNDSDTKVRLTALNQLIDFSNEQPSLRSAIEQAARADASDVIRRTAANAVIQK